MGNSYGALDKNKKSLESYHKALEINPKRYQAYLNMFDIYGAERKYLPKEIDDKFLKYFKDDKNIYVVYLVFT